MSIKKFLDLSTGHLPANDRVSLEMDDESDSLPFRTAICEYGFSIWLQDKDAMDKTIEVLENKLDYTDALGHVIRYAMRHDCGMINFDRDAERIEELEYFD